MKAAPDPKDVQEFQFKQSNTSQILDAFTSIPTACSLLAVDRKRGLLYAGQNNKIVILKPGEDRDPEWKIEFNLSLAVSKLMLNCDCSYLAVAPHGPLILIYDAQAFVKSSLQLLYEIRISTSNADVFVSDLRWNPAVPGMLCTIASDYTVGSFKIKEKKEKAIELKALEKFNDLDALCSAWSPKGKQIVVGCKNGSIVQFKPDLKIARSIPGPNPYLGEVVSILWISNYQFCAAYLSNEEGVNVLIIDAPKGETTAIFTCYEDITYGVGDAEGEGTIPRYYFDHIPEWGLIIAASSNSSEIAVLGSTDKGVSWNQWQLVDSGRAELPLICTTESYPVGLAIDRTPTRRLPWGADATLPHPVPILHILATSGQLCSFHMVNLAANCPPINSPPTEIVATPPQARSNVCLEASFVTDGLATSTPRPKQPENLLDPRAKPVPPGNIFDKFVISANQQQQQQLQQQKQKPAENLNMEMKLEQVKEAQQQQVPQKVAKADNKTPVKETVSQQEPVEQKPSADDDARINRAYLEEHNLFEKELRNRLEPQMVECGTEEERRKLVDTSVVLDQFLRELKETTNSLSSDIAYLKALLLQSFAWVEETKSKNAASNDITARSCGDSKISDLQKLYYYTQTQLSQASKILDLEWSDHKCQEMARMKIPHLEFVYQNLILHNKIIQEEKNKMEQLKKRWKLITRNNSIFGLNRSLSGLSIASSKSSSPLPRNAGIIEARCKAIASKTLSFTHAKQMKLKEHLANSTPRIIKPVNPSPIQHRLEATLSSLASLDATAAEAKSKAEHAVSKQSPISKQQTAEKAKQQNPLASLNSIVARIGTGEVNNVSPQSKTQSKQPPFGGTLFSPTSASKPPMQAEKLSTLASTALPPQAINKSKPESVILNQPNILAQSIPSIMKSFPRVDSISFGMPSQKPEEQKSEPKESGVKVANEPATQKIEPYKVAPGAWKDALSLEIAADKPQQTDTSNAALKFGMMAMTTSATKSEAMSTFSFASPISVPVVAKTTPQSTFATSQSPTSAQAFSFALKPSTTNTSSSSSPFSLKPTPSSTTPPQTQDSSGLTGLFTGLQTSNQAPSSQVPAANNLRDSDRGYGTTYGKFVNPTTSANVAVATANDKPAFGSPSFQMFAARQVSISVVRIAASKDDAASTATVTPAGSVTIEEIPTTTEAKTPNPPASPGQALPASSAAAPLFATPTSNVSIFGGTASSPQTTSTFTVTTTTPVAQTTTTASVPLFSGFGGTPPATTTASTLLLSYLSKPTFGKPTINVPVVSSPTATPTTSATLTFGNVATTTTAAPVFEKPSLAMAAQFPSTPAAVSSAANTFGNPAAISPTSMPFGSSTNTSIFGQMPASTSASIFSGSNTTSSIFGGNAQATSPGSIFGGNATTINTFGTPPQKSIFESSAAKTDSIFGSQPSTGTPSFFGGAASNVTPGLASAGSPSVFGGATANTAPMGVEQPVMGAQPAFGQAPTFNTKPVFGSPPTFGAPKPIFSGGFGATAFGVSATPPAFGSPPAMGAAAAPIDNNIPKVFGSVGGSSTFESLASQSGGLSFSSLAQKSPEAPKSPAFASGRSFSTWR